MGSRCNDDSFAGGRRGRSEASDADTLDAPQSSTDIPASRSIIVIRLVNNTSDGAISYSYSYKNCYVVQ